MSMFFDKKMQRMMKQMGLQMEDIDASKVTIETGEGNIIISNPQVAKMKMQGQETWQITGDAIQEEKEKFSEEDIEMITSQTGASEEEAKAKLEETGDIAEAILQLSEED